MYKALYNVQTSVTIYYNHIFKVVNMILQRSVKNMLSLLIQRERSIIISGMALLVGIGGGGSV
jgi:hypothetical protein